MSRTNGSEQYNEVSRAHPCPICKHDTWCRVSPDGKWCACRRESKGCHHAKVYSDGDAFIHLLRDEPLPHTPNGKSHKRKIAHPPADTATIGPNDSATPEELDKAYGMYLAELQLDYDHFEALHARGFSEETIDRNGYKSAPGFDSIAGLKVIYALQELGIDLSRIPGFSYSKLKFRNSGILIPVRNPAGQIIALKFRRDEPSEKGNRYYYLTSHDRESKTGASPGTPAHTPVGTPDHCEECRLTEGELKADRATEATGIPTISFPGVSAWRVTIPVVQQLRCKIIRLAFDTDAEKNPHVARALAQSFFEVTSMGLEVKIESWDRQAKGIDDAIQAGLQIDVLSGPQAEAEVKRIAAAAGVDLESLNAAESKGQSATEAPAEQSREELDKRHPKAITNGIVFEHDDGQIIYPIPMVDIIRHTLRQTDGWPRRVGNALFVHCSIHGIAWLAKPQDLFGYLQSSVGKVIWHGGKDLVSRAELHSELQRTADAFKSIEPIPHEPPIAGAYYACAPITPGDGSALEHLISQFVPDDPIDRELIRLAFVTPMWGGEPGARPAFLVTSDDGRGVGKTTVAEIVGELYGGVISFSANDDINKVKTRLLSPEGITKRVVLLDNIKSSKYSSSDVEAMITASTIGGHKMYLGEATRPNTIVWFLTINGAALSCDMAQRSVIIKIKRPERSATWRDDTIRLIRSNRERILGDILAYLRRDKSQLAEFTRWSTWERDVLQCLPDPVGAQKVIMARQNVVDVDREESEIIENYFADRLTHLRYDTLNEKVFIPSPIAAQWLNAATNERNNVIQSGRLISQMANERKFSRIVVNRTYGRGCIWFGEQANSNIGPALDLTERISNLENEKTNFEQEKLSNAIRDGISRATVGSDGYVRSSYKPQSEFQTEFNESF